MERPDSPCIAICTTALGDDVCAGCGRTFAEISQWVFMTPQEREAAWQRLETFWAEQGKPAPWLSRPDQLRLP